MKIAMPRPSMKSLLILWYPMVASVSQLERAEQGASRQASTQGRVQSRGATPPPTLTSSHSSCTDSSPVSMYRDLQICNNQICTSLEVRVRICKNLKIPTHWTSVSASCWDMTFAIIQHTAPSHQRLLIIPRMCSTYEILIITRNYWAIDLECAKYV